MCFYPIKLQDSWIINLPGRKQDLHFFLLRNSYEGTITCVARCTQSCPELRKLVLDWFIGGLATLKIIQDEKVIKF